MIIRLIDLTLSLIVFGSLSAAQGLFPLQAGNQWHYRGIEISDPGRNLLADSQRMMPNGHSYTLVSGSWRPDSDTSFVRQSDSLVLVYDSADYSEYALLNFNGRVGDTISVRHNPDQIVTLISVDTVQLLGRSRRVLAIADAGTSYTEFIGFIDSIGIGFFNLGSMVEYTLDGGVVDGVILTRVSDPPGLQQVRAWRLAQNFPNPFNPSTSISFTIPTRAHVILRIYNLFGQLVTTLVDADKQPGSYSVPSNASNMPSGMYFYRIEAGKFLETKKMVLLR